MTTVKRVSYFPGCSLESSAREYDESARAACAAIGVELAELEDWTCCGATHVHSQDGLLDVALPARTLQQVSQLDGEVVVCCPACFSRLKLAQHALKDAETRKKVSSVLGADVRNGAQVVPVLKLFESALGKLPVAQPLTGLKAVSYYGCKWVRPYKLLEFEEEGNPTLLDRIMRAAGAEALDWGLKTECCGASLGIARPETVLRLSYRLLAAAKNAGAECVVVACPLCQHNLDAYQRDIEAKYGERIGLPVLYFTQLLGLSFGLPLEKLMFQRHFVDPRPLLRSKGLLKA